MRGNARAALQEREVAHEAACETLNTWSKHGAQVSHSGVEGFSGLRRGRVPQTRREGSAREKDQDNPADQTTCNFENCAP